MTINYLLVFVPAALALDWYDANPLLIFLAAAVAVVPLSDLIGQSTEDLGTKLGETLGGMLNATMGNLPEMIIGIFALRKGLQTVVKASLTGSILGNILFILGLAIIAGGMRRPTLHYNINLAGVNSKLLLLAAIGLIVPALANYASSGLEDKIGVEIAVILFAAYLASLAFTLVTHKRLFQTRQPEGPMEGERQTRAAGWASLILAVAAGLLAAVSETLTGALEPTAKQLHLTPVFAGIFLLATVGNASGLINAVRFARRNKMDLALSITLGAAAQAALLVAPVLVLSSYLVGHPMDLLFSQFEVVAISLAVVIGRTMTADGESSWVEGVMLVAVYAMLGVGFFYLRPTTGHMG
ncbi:MAG TPA: calcium/proton exchanger [Pirellulales bacterium]|nr:calcium/proton exchanger [Pirellulales bacterium]